jgi:hypothetical protein
LSPVVEAAWIAAVPGSLGIIGTVVVSVVGSRTTRQATIATINAGHSARVWEKRAAAYEEAVREVLARRTRREATTSRGDLGGVESKAVEELFQAEESEIIRIRAALRPYTSAEVWTAYKAADEANTAFWVSLSNLASANATAQYRAGRLQQAVTADELPPEPDYQGALDAMYEARSAAATADEAFFDVINRELG